MINKITKAVTSATNVGKAIGSDIGKGIANGIINNTVSDINSITTFAGTFIFQTIKGKMCRSVTFSTGYGSSRNNWMEDALYGILYTYNNLRNQSNLDLVSANDDNNSDNRSVYYRLGDGIHNLKYRNYDIMLFVNHGVNTGATGYVGNRSNKTCTYTVSTFSLDEAFVIQFEKDMIRRRNDIMKFQVGRNTVDVYKDSHESDGWTYWDKMSSIGKRGIRTVYLEPDVKTNLVDTINRFFSEKKYYTEHGIAHNLKILLHGPAGPQPNDTKIPSPMGMKLMGELVVGDSVYNHRGLPTTIIGVYPQGNQVVYELKFGDGRNARSTIDHLWQVNWDIGNGNIVTAAIPLKEIIDEMKKGRKFTIPVLGYEDKVDDIVSVTMLPGLTPTTCIKIADESHLYLTENFVITHNTGKDTIAKMIASEWHRNIYYATGGKGGRFVPDCLTSKFVTRPLFMVSDVDRYPFLINDELPVPEGAQDSAAHQEENKQTFAHMINALDGVMSGEDRIIIMTTNHIEKFSSTFLRPGRVDLILEIGRVTASTFRRFTYDFYGKLLPPTIKLIRDDIAIPELQADVVFSRMSYENFIAKYVK